ESGGPKQVDSFWDILGFGDTLDEFWNETLNILVDDERADLLHCSVCRFLNFRLGIPHRRRNDWDKIRDTISSLCRGACAKRLDQLQIGHLLGPFLCVVDRVDK